MGVTTALHDPQLYVEPGQVASCRLDVLNDGTVVDQITVDVMGEAVRWATVDPPVLNLLPGERATVVVTFHPPRSPESRAGSVPFAVRARSQEDPAGSVAAEGVIEVAGFSELSTVLAPLRSRGSRRGRHRLTVLNRGNLPLGLTVRLFDDGDQLTFRLRRRRMVVPPGQAGSAGIRVVPRSAFLRGMSERHPFHVVVVPDEGEPVATDAELVQQPVLAPWAMPVGAAGLVLVMAAMALWLTVLKPTIRSAASDAVRAQMSPMAAAVDDARKRAAAAADAADANRRLGLGSGSGGQPTPQAPGAVLTKPVDYRIQANAAPRTDNGFNVFAVSGQNGKPLDVSDIQLQNPAGDQGTVEVRRNKVVWLRFGLANFRDYDDHFVVPVRFNRGDTVVFAVDCTNPGGKHCTPALTFSGRTTG